jgi:sugar/nucleoside kinase (ribokinase family)
MADWDVLVAGEINPDLILSDPALEPRFGQEEVLVESAELTIGSSSAIFACGAARLGLRVGFIGVVGDDEFGRFMCDSLASARVDVSAVIVDKKQPTGLSVILSRGTDRAILTFLGAMCALQGRHITDSLLGKARHLHVGSLFLQTGLQGDVADLFRRARTLGLTTSLDTNWDPAGVWKGVEEILPWTDVCMPNAQEAQALTRARDPVLALERLAEAVPCVAVKMGSEGAIARRGTETARAAALTTALVDTVGAGDSFDAGFLYGLLHHWPLDQSLRLGVACGSLSTRAAGGTAAQPTLAEAQMLMEGG